MRRQGFFAHNPESESYLFFGQVEMSRGGRNGFGGRGGGRGRSRYVFIIFFQSENIFVSSFSRSLLVQVEEPKEGKEPGKEEEQEQEWRQEEESFI